MISSNGDAIDLVSAAVIVKLLMIGFPSAPAASDLGSSSANVTAPFPTDSSEGGLPVLLCNDFVSSNQKSQHGWTDGFVTVVAGKA